MIYQDRIYGQVEITEPIILELINSPALQRLKGIDQRGYFEPYAPGTAHSRFEHSLGVFILLKKFKAPLEEQVAGLIHDISHGVFSHCIDYVLDVGSPKKQDHQDNIFADYVKQTTIPQILSKYGFSMDYILDDKNFPLKERVLPDLCADRIDYSLRTALIFGEADLKLVTKLVNNFVIKDKHWVFKDFASAKTYSQLFLRLNTDYYCGFTSGLMFATVGDFIKHSLEKGYLTEADLYSTDKEVLAKAKRHLKKDKKLALFWRRMNNQVKTDNNPQNFDVQVFCKSRIVDPLFKEGNKVRRFSERFPEWKAIVRKESQPKEYFIKFKDN